jgi:hypothetical protein
MSAGVALYSHWFVCVVASTHALPPLNDMSIPDDVSFRSTKTWKTSGKNVSAVPRRRYLLSNAA